MNRIRLTLAGSMGLVLFLGLAMVALRDASPGWAGFFLLFTLALLTLALLGAIFRRRSARAFFVGFALLGWSYMILISQFWWQHPTASPKWKDPDFPPELITTSLLDELYPVIGVNVGSDAQSSWLRGFVGSIDRRNAPIYRALDLPLSMPFVNETPLEDVIKYIRKATTSPALPGGIPVYVDPVGLTEAEKTMASPITLSLEGVGLGQSLKLILKQLDLSYSVKDGLMTITSTTTGGGGVEPVHFRLIGHCLFALLFACIGGFVGRAFWNAESRRAPAS